jgi:hypothetical protein
MNNVVIPFFNYNRGDANIGRLLVKHVLRNLHKYADADAFYFVGDNMGWFEDHTDIVNGKPIHYVCNTIDGGAFQRNVWLCVQRMQADDKFLMLDSDLMIYDDNLVRDLFKYLDDYDIVSTLDGATYVQPTTPNESKDVYKDLMMQLPVMCANQYRGYRTRFTHWVFGCRAGYFKDRWENEIIAGNFQPFEHFSRTVAEHHSDAKIKEMLEFRNNLLLDKSGKIYSFMNIDDVRCTDAALFNSGYYHIRNFGACAKQMAYITEAIDYGGTPFTEKNYSEIMRLIAWNLVLWEKTLPEKNQTYIDLTNRILTEHCDISIKIQDEAFQNYLNEFKKFYRTELL